MGKTDNLNLTFTDTDSNDNTGQQQQGNQQQLTAQQQQPNNFIPNRYDQVSADEINGVLSLIEDNPSLANHPEVKKLLEMANKLPQNGNGQQQQNQNNNQQQNQNNQGQYQTPLNQNNGQQQDQQKPNPQLSIISDSPFFKNATAEFTNLTIDKLPEYINKTFNIDITKPEGTNQFVSVVNKFRNDSQDLGKASKDLEDVKATFQAMPVQMRLLYDAFVANKIASPDDVVRFVDTPLFRFDFSRPFESQNLETAIRFYFPTQQFDTNDFKPEGLKDPRMSTLVDTAKALYEKDKISISAQRAKITEDIQKSKTAYDGSVKSSVDALKSKYPGFGSAELASVNAILSSNRIGDLFYDKNGNLKSDAAERIALAKYGDSFLESIAAKIIKKESSQKNVEMVNNANTEAERRTANPGADNGQQQGNQFVTDWTGGSDPYSSRRRK